MPSLLVTRRFTALNGTAVLIGLIAGFAAVGFRYFIDLIENIAFRQDFTATVRDESGYITTTLGILVFTVPAAGGLLVGLVRQIFPSIRRQGIAEVMAAVQVRGGLIKGRTAWGHAVLSAITVGTGGSSGREGPIGYIGAALGSSFGRRLGFRARDIKVLLGAGTAAGIAATFNAPLGGVLFAMELILPEFSTHAFIPVVIATVVGVTVGHVFFGDIAAFSIPADFALASPWELLNYLVLGVVCGLGGVMFIRMMGYASERGESLRMPAWLKPALGGLLVGIMGLAIFSIGERSAMLGFMGQYHVFGTGYGTVSAILTGDSLVLVIPLLLLLIIAKPIASSITIGSGGGGGVFSSSLMQGALYGAIMGITVNALAPFPTAPVSAYALVGMAGFYAATGRATLTTIILMYEFTGSRTIILPLMFAAVTADAVSVGLSRDSIYTVRLTKRGIRYEHDRTQSPLDVCSVGEVMTTEVDTLSGEMTAGDAFNQMLEQGHTGFPVVNDEGIVLGMITRRDLSKHLHDGRGDEHLKDLVSGLLITAYPADRLFSARDKIFSEDIGRLMIVDPLDRKRLVGILTRSDILRAEASRDVEHTDAWSAAS